MPAAQLPTPTKSCKRLSAQISQDYTMTSNSDLSHNTASFISYPSTSDKSPTTLRTDRNNMRSELYNQNQRVLATQYSSRDWLERYAGIAPALAYSIRDLFWVVLSLDSRFLALYVALKIQIPQVPSIRLSVNDSICLIDAFGHERRLQYSTHRHFSVFKAFLSAEYKHTPGGPYIAQERYRLLDTSAPLDIPLDEES